MVTGDKTSDTALNFLVESWQVLGLPKIVQFDNEMSFTGGRWAHRLGRVVRLCLILGVQPWFIPFYTPKRNGYVESFHGECDRSFWSRTQFADRSQVQAAYPAFLSHFRDQRHLPAIQHHTPTEMRAIWADVPRQLLPADFRLHQQKRLPLVAGRIYCVRLADNQGQVNILNRHLTLGSKYAKHYVLAQIETDQQQMNPYYRPTADEALEKITTEPFPLQEPIHDFNPDFDYPPPSS